MKTIEQLEKENAELRAATERLKSQFKEYMQTADIDIYINAMNKAPVQLLANIKADAVVNAANKVIRHNESGFCIHCSVVGYADKLRGESE